ncbi:MAG: hypothetical protein H0V09_02655 [Gemmatimonadetes bacterium]|nr:hypothetical protein [Gemmatimonadota bacterium]
MASAGTGAAGGGPGGAAMDALLRSLEQLQGVPIPASALESQVLAARVPGYSPALLDGLGASGELVWAGGGALGTRDGWVTLALAESAALLLPEPEAADPLPLAATLLEVLGAGGALFFRQLADGVGRVAAGTADGLPAGDADVISALWDLVWAGRVTNDTFAPLRALLWRARTRSRPDGRGRPARPRPVRMRSGSPRIAGPPRLAGAGPPAGAGRWSLLPERETDPTRRIHAVAEQLLQRHGLVTRGALGGERVPGGFAAVYPVLKAFEDAGRCRRGYFVEGLGGAQFALLGAVDRMRALVDVPSERLDAQVLAATDPANPYGAALPWPERGDEDSGHRPGRKAGAVVTLVNGVLVLYVERGGRTLLTYAEDEALVRSAAEALAGAARDGRLGRIAVERADGEAVRDTPLARALLEAGFRPTLRGLRARA